MTKHDAALDVREELASVAASLRAYLEWQQDTGAIGIPRRPRSTTTTREEAPPTEVPPQTEPRSPAPARVTAPAPVTVAAPAPVAVAVTVAAPVAVRAPVVVRGLAVVEGEAKGCTKCGLAATRTNVVFSRGSPKARLVFIGEAPGADEDETGQPFVGRAGQLLDKMIGAMGLDPQTDVYVCNIIKCRPPGNRRPEPIEVETCIPYLHEQLANIEPKAIVVLGNTAVAGLLGSKLGITKVRGQWKLYRGKIPVMPTYHPSYLLRPSPQQTEAKKQAWEDLQAVMKELGLPTKKVTT